MKSDSDAQALWDRYSKIQELKDFKERKEAFSDIKKDGFYDRVISVRERKRNERIMPIYPEMRGPGSYDEETGYIKEDTIGEGGSAIT